jgi:hypothetical protein
MTITTARIEQLRRNANRLKKKLKGEGQNITHTEALCLVAKDEGFNSWEQLLTQVQAQPSTSVGNVLENPTDARLKAAGFVSWDEVRDVLTRVAVNRRASRGHGPSGTPPTPKERAARQILLDILVRYSGMSFDAVSEAMAHKSVDYVRYYVSGTENPFKVTRHRTKAAARSGSARA